MQGFPGKWGAIKLPIQCEVAVVDEGDKPAIGLSAMQMDNLQVKNGNLQISHNNKSTSAYVWNAYGVHSTGEGHRVRITKALAQALGCETGDLIQIDKVNEQITPVKVSIN